MSKNSNLPADPTRRLFLVKLAAAGLSAPLLSTSFAQMNHSHGGGMATGKSPIGPDVLEPDPTPAGETQCAFCGMTIATPDKGSLPAGFRERTYAQIRLINGDTLHFESIACMINYAYAVGIKDGEGATFYVANEAGRDQPQHGLVAARHATFIWAEGLKVSMMSNVAAYPNEDAAMAAITTLENPGRHYRMDAAKVYDLAPLRTMNLIPLLARASGLVS